MVCRPGHTTCNATSLLGDVCIIPKTDKMLFAKINWCVIQRRSCTNLSYMSSSDMGGLSFKIMRI